MMRPVESSAGFRFFLDQVRDVVGTRLMVPNAVKVAALRRLADELESSQLDLDRWRAFYVEVMADPSRRPGYMLDAAGRRLSDPDSLLLLALVPLVASVRHHQLGRAVEPQLTLILPAACWQSPEQVDGGRLLEMPIRLDPRATWPAVAVEVI